MVNFIQKINGVCPFFLSTILILSGCSTIKQLQSAEFKPVPAAIRSDPMGAEVYINGKLVGKTPIETPLKPRGKEWPENWECEIRVVKKGYIPETRIVRLNEIDQPFALARLKGPDGAEVETREKEVSAEPQISDGYGIVSVDSSAGVSDIYIDELFVGNTPAPLLKLTKGPHDVKIKKSGFKEWNRKLNVLNQSKQTIKAEPEKEGALVRENSFERLNNLLTGE